MKKRILAIASVAVLVVAATVLALAQGHQGGGERMREPNPEQMIEHMSQALDLTEAQKTQARALFESGRAGAEERRTKLEAIHKQIEDATANGQFDEAVVRPLANQQAQLMADEMVDHMQMHSKLFGLLNAEQKVKAAEMMKQHAGPGHGPGGPGGHGHHGPPPAPGF